MSHPTLSCRDLRLEINGHRILGALDLQLPAAGLTGLIGPNGSGKSTLLRLLAGVVEPSAGELRFGDQRYAASNREQRARGIAYIPQQIELHWPIEVERLIQLGRLPHLDGLGRDRHPDANRIPRLLRETDTEHLRNRCANTLSGGERARVMLARALATEPDTLLADEPTATLDPAHQIAMLELLRRHSQAGHALCISLHDLTLAARYCDRLVLLDQGRLVAEGSPAKVLTPDNLEGVYGIERDPDASNAYPPGYPWRLADTLTPGSKEKLFSN